MFCTLYIINIALCTYFCQYYFLYKVQFFYLLF
nr:MAG TPA: hypothetical protein [Bacteriophage sp.]DAV56579.1 MAG TPA: hypothetical protein [Caudoviricetes sp.]